MTAALLDPCAPCVGDDARRREFLAGGVAALLTLAGCGADSDDRASQERSTVTVKHAGGRSEVPVAPERIVTLDGYVDLQTLLLFGVGPVLAGVSANLAKGFLAARLDGVGRTAERGVENLELIARTRPDVILGAEYDAERYEQLSAIAPTVLLDRYGATVDDHIRLIGRILGREQDAERFVADWKERVAATRARIRRTPLARTLVAMVAEDVYEGDFSAFGPKSYGGRTLTAVGVDVLDPGGRSDGEDFAFGSDLSTERLGVLEPAELILQQAYRAGNPGGRSIEESPLWLQLPAVRRGAVIEVDGDVWYQDTALSRLARLKDIERIATRVPRR